MFRSILAVVAALVASAAMAADNYPSRPVKIIVPFAAGGPADVYARVLADRLEKSMGQAFVVEDKPGGGSLVGTEVVQNSAPDGYTLLMMSNTHTVNETLIPNKPFELMRDFVPISPVNYSDLVLVINPSVHAKTLKEFIALAKSKPGVLNYASSGPGTPYHMAGELFKAMAGVNIVHIPFKGSSGARTAVLGGQVQMMFDAITTMSQNVRTGKVVALGTTGKARSKVLPEVPTISEAGVPGYEAVIWLGVMAPRGTPQPIVDRLNAEIRKVVNAPDIEAAWTKQGATAMSMTPAEFATFLRADIEAAWTKQGATAMSMTPAEFDTFLRADIEKWAKIVKISGARQDR